MSKQAKAVVMTDEIRKALCKHKQENPTRTQVELKQWLKTNFDIGVSQPTISQTLKRSSEILAREDGSTSGKRHKNVAFPAMEKALEEWILINQSRVSITGDLIKETGSRILELMYPDHGRFDFSNGWLHRFKIRRGIKSLRNISLGIRPSSSNEVLLLTSGRKTPKKSAKSVGCTAVLAERQHVTTKSDEIFKAAKDLMPGGVNSPVRAFKSVGGQPIVFDRVKGSHAWDVDGNEYVDYIGTWGPAIIGHADDEVNAALVEALKKGTSFGAPCALENVLAEMVIAAVPSIEMVRFVNSGTEACMGMLRLARAYTGREKIIKFDGCYHGHADSFLVQAGSGVATLGLPDSPGVPAGATAGTLVAPYNDLEAVKKLLADNKGEIAAVVLEPVVGNSGFIIPNREFLEGLREITKEHDVLLVFDEVMTGFRISYGGAQEYFGVTPDLTTLGKIIGGGLPVGAYGGRREIMEMVAPAGPVYQAGTLSGNPLAMTAGIKTLQRLQAPGTYEYLDKVTGRLINGLLEAGRAAGHEMCGGHINGMFGFFFTAGPVYNFTDAKKSDTAKFGRFHRAMLQQGVYLAPSQYEAGFTGLCHTDADVDFTIAAAKEVFKTL